MASAWDIKQEILNCIIADDGTMVSGITGELLDEKKLNELQMTFDEKVKNIALWIKNLDNDLDGYAKTIDSLKARRDRDKRLKDNLTNYLMTLLDGKKRKTPEYEVTYRKSKAVHVVDESLIPEQYLKTQPPKVSLMDIKRALQDGKEVEGCVLEERVSMKVK